MLESAIRAVLLLVIALAAQYLLSYDAHKAFADLVASAVPPAPPAETKHIPVAKSEREVNKQQAQSVRI